MNHRILVTVVVGGLLLAGAGVAAAQNLSANATARAEAKASCEPYRESGDRDALRECVKASGAGRGRLARAAHRGAPFETDGDLVTGKWVSFRVDAAGGALVDFTSRGPMADAVVFDRVSVARHDAASAEAGARGGVFGVRDGSFDLRVVNAPSAGLFLRTALGNVVTFDPAEGVTLELVTDESGNAMTARVLRDGHAASIRLTGEGALALADDGRLVATLGEGAGLRFHVDGHPPQGPGHGPRGLHRDGRGGEAARVE